MRPRTQKTDTADALITDDPDALDYAKSLSSSQSTVGLGPRLRVDIANTLARVSYRARLSDLPASLCDAFAHDAVKVDARGGSNLVRAAEAAGAIYRSTDDEHDVSSFPFTPHRRVAYSRGDKTSQDLAERIVALAGMDTTSSADARAIFRAIPGLWKGTRTVGLDPTSFSASADNGEELAYIVPLSW
jgi:hypothetical protein